MSHADRTRARLLRGVDHIERNIAGQLRLGTVAAKAALSEFHFHRLFRARFGLPVMDYVRRRRLARAAEALLKTDAPIIEIALEAGFQSQASFTRGFRKVYHASPGMWRARGREIPWLSSAPIGEAMLALFPGLGESQPRLERIDAFNVAGVEAVLEATARAQIRALQERLVMALGYERFLKSELIGISGGGDSALGGFLHYMSAIVSEGDAEPGQGLTRREVPGGAYLKFSFQGPYAKIAAAHDFIFGIWMPGSRHALDDRPSFTRASAQDAIGGGAIADHGAIEIWIPVRES